MDLTKEFNLDEEMAADSAIIELLQDKETAKEFYAALCNVDWEKEFVGSEEDKVFDILKGSDCRIWSCSWRYAGGVIADIRNKAYNVAEDYMDFYCSKEEGIVSDIVRENFKRIGWVGTPI